MAIIRLSKAANQGVSLLVLIFAITILSVFGVGLSTLMYARFRSFPYVTASHQAQALADAGVEFAIRYAKDNAADFATNPGTYIPTGSYKPFPFGKGRFELKYVPGCPDVLYSRGVCGVAVREVRISKFSLFAKGGGSLVLASAPTRTAYSSGIYSGDEVRFTYCDPDLLVGETSNVLMNPIIVASTAPARLMRVAPTRNWASWPVWVWDAVCPGGECGPPVGPVGREISGWNGTSDPPNVAYPLVWNVGPATTDPAKDTDCRPRFPPPPPPNSCPDDNTIDPSCSPTYTRSQYMCWNTGLPSDVDILSTAQPSFTMQFLGNITLPNTFFVRFDHRRKDGSVVTNTFVFRISS